MVSPVPPPSVAVTADTNRTLYADEDVTFTCDITLDPAVDSEVAVTASWTGPGGPITAGVSDITGSGPYQSTLTLSSLTTSNSGLYTCTASVDLAPLVVGSGDGTGSHTITVGKGPEHLTHDIQYVTGFTFQTLALQRPTQSVLQSVEHQHLERRTLWCALWGVCLAHQPSSGLVLTSVMYP